MKLDVSKEIVQKYDNIQPALSVTFPCGECNRTFISLDDLKKHDLVNHRKIERNSSKCFQCDKCPYDTNVKQNFEKHRERHVIYVEKLQKNQYYTCSHCPQSFRGLETLEEHKRHVHSDSVK